MSKTLLTNIIDFFLKKTMLFYVLLISFIVILGFGITKIQVNESILSTLPQGETFTKLSTFVENNNNKIVFSIAVQDLDEVEIDTLIIELQNEIKVNAENLIIDIKGKREGIQDEIFNYYYDNFPLFIDSLYYQDIESKLSKDSIDVALNNSYRKLVSPGSSVLKDFILRDPLFLSSSFFKTWGEGMQSASSLKVDRGYLYSSNGQEVLITANTNFQNVENGTKLSLYDKLLKFKTKWNLDNKENPVSYFGTFLIEAENRIQIKKDTFLTMTISIISILLILFIYYRKILIPIYFMLPVIFGALFSLGIIGYFKPNISGISLATGAVVLGIVLDYSFHFFTHLKHVRSIRITVQEIGTPLFIGSLTTITAFAALLFVDSVVLQDFGLFASLSLGGSVLFTLIFLPIILHQVNFNCETFASAVKEPKLKKPKKYLTRIGVPIITILTAVFLYFSFDIEFDNNLSNLSFHTDQLKLEEELLVGINPEAEKKLFIFSEANSFDEAAEINYNLYRHLQPIQNRGEISNVISASKFIIPALISTEKRLLWDEFWETRRCTLQSQIGNLSNNLGFSDDAFSKFNTWIAPKNKNVKFSKELAEKIGLSDLIHENEGRTTFITTLVVKKDNLETLKTSVNKIKGVQIFDRAETAEAMIEIVKGDFNYILIVSSLIVFITLLLIYGRIELALLAFIPMVISWIWILGIAVLLGIKFNFVNIVISTFIFGLGDDFSIFITDGLLAKYKYKKESLSSYKTAILLSAATTIIGTGVLFFAEHPAIKSVAIISVLGIVCILIISLIFQPVLFNIFVQNRVDNQKSPITVITIFNSLIGYTVFISGCLFNNLILLVIYVIPIPKRNKKEILNSVISAFGKVVVYSVPTMKKRIEKMDLDFKKPSIIIANHSSFLDILLMIMLNRKIVLMTNSWVYKSLLFGFSIQYAGYLFTGDGPEKNLKLTKQRIKEGYSVMIFPEGTRSMDGKIKRFHKGAFYLSEELELDISPIVIHGASYSISKNDFILKSGTISLRALPRIKYEDRTWGDDYRSRTKSISKYFKQEYLKLAEEREDSKYLWQPLFENYVFKGPILEWYLRIKWKFESKNFEHYNKLIGARKTILDVGCGYGYLDFYLSLKNADRVITGIDYDEEKINIAKNSLGKLDSVNFISQDIKEYEFEQYDVVFLNDVLHYFSTESQNQILINSVTSLSEHGLLIIRDGVTNYPERHKKTALTEFFSTKLRFNVQKESFSFFDISFITSFADRNNLTCEIIEQSKKTSNILFILKK